MRPRPAAALFAAAALTLGAAAACTTPEPAPAPLPSAVPGSLGKPAKVGSWEVTAYKATCDTKLGEVKAEPERQWCAVEVKVTNRGAAAKPWPELAQKALDDVGGEYRADPRMTPQANKGTPVWAAEIGPGGSRAGTVVFDLPADVRLVGLEVHAAVHDEPGVGINLTN